jgi:TRAP-type C4-dicarboxylate transport system substrate-binding protein
MKNLKGVMFILLALMLTLTTIVVPSKAEKTYTMRFACDFTSTHPAVIRMQRMAKLLEEETHGRIKLEIYPAGSLYSGGRVLQAVQSGSVEACLGGIAAGSISPEWATIGVTAFLFNDYNHFLRFSKTDSYKAMQKRLETKGFVYLSPLDWTFTYIFNEKRPIKSLEDWKGLKLGFPPVGPIKLMAEAFGYSVVTVNVPERVTALETGMIDGTMGTTATYKQWELGRLCPYVNKIPMILAENQLIVGKKWWDSLPTSDQKLIQRAATEATKDSLEYGMKADREMWRELAGMPGVVITELTAAEAARWRAIMRTLRPKISTDPNVKEMLEAIDAVR